MSSTVSINGGEQTVPGPGRDTSWGTYTTNLLSALSINAGKDVGQCIFVNSNGTDTAVETTPADGLTPAKSVKTLGKAITLAAALSPASGAEVAL